MPLLDTAPVGVALDSSGGTESGALLNVYAAGTTTPSSLFSDKALSVAIANPVVFSSAGRPQTEVYVATGSYKLDLQTSAGSSLPGYPIDNVSVISSGVDNLSAATAPTANDDSDDGYAVGSRWIDTTADVAYICVDATVSAAVWNLIMSGVVDDTTPQLGGALDGQGADITGIGVLTMVEQAAAEADVAGNGQWWVQTATPNVAMFTDDAGTDFTLSQAAASQAEAEAGTEAALRSFSPQRVAQAIAALASGGVSSVAVQAFTSSGTYTPTSGMAYCIAFATGGGGGAGGADESSGSRCGAGGGGGAGGTGIRLIDAATIGASQTVTIGAAGAAGDASGGAGGAGGDTTLGALLTGGGGSGGGSGNQAAGAGGAGGTASSGDLNIPGGQGGQGFTHSNPAAGSGGSIGGHGGASMWGGGAAGSTRYATQGSSAAGTNASVYGSGGGGASVASSTTGAAGGTGAAGVVFVVEFVA